MSPWVVHIESQPALRHGDAHAHTKVSFVFCDDRAVQVDRPSPAAGRTFVGRAHTRDAGNARAATGAVAAGGTRIAPGPSAGRLYVVNVCVKKSVCMIQSIIGVFRMK